MSLLKKKLGDYPLTTVELPLIADNGDILIKPAVILDTRWIKKGSRFVEESLVKWKQLPDDDATWKNARELWERFTNLNLEDKVPLNGGGIDKPRRSHRVPIKNLKFIELWRSKWSGTSHYSIQSIRQEGVKSVFWFE